MDDEPQVGERRASTLYRDATFDDNGSPPPDAVWTVDEWDGSRWRRIGTAKGDRERDRMLWPTDG